LPSTAGTWTKTSKKVITTAKTNDSFIVVMVSVEEEVDGVGS
jgi:hypothetical protein